MYNSRTSSLGSNDTEDIKQEDIIIDETNQSETSTEDDNETVKELESIKNHLEDIVEKNETRTDSRNFRKIFDGI